MQLASSRVDARVEELEHVNGELTIKLAKYAALNSNVRAVVVTVCLCVSALPVQLSVHHLRGLCTYDVAFGHVT